MEERQRERTGGYLQEKNDLASLQTPAPAKGERVPVELEGGGGCGMVKEDQNTYKQTHSNHNQ